MMNKQFTISNNRQQGVILITSLIFLLVMSVLSVGSMQSTMLQERMASNEKEINIAFQAAEAALRSGESWLQAQPTKPTVSRSANQANSEVWALNSANPDISSAKMWWQEADVNWWANITNATPSAGVAGVASPPTYVAEELDHIQDSLNVGTTSDNAAGSTYYRMTARGEGGNSATQVMVQSIYTKRF
jgi:type IV pilus assembly protein PilX